MACWAEYFEQLFKVNPPSRWLQTTVLQVVYTDPSINETTLSLEEIKEAVARWRGGKEFGICNISLELLKAGGEVMIHGLHAV